MTADIPDDVSRDAEACGWNAKPGTDRQVFTEALETYCVNRRKYEHSGDNHDGMDTEQAERDTLALYDAKQAEGERYFAAMEWAVELAAELVVAEAECDRLREALRYMPPDTFIERVFRTAERMVEGSDFTVAVTAFEAAAIRARLAPAKE